MKSRFFLTIISIFLFTLIYSIIRYNIFNDVPWSQFPLFISNKAISFSALIYLSIFIVLKKNGYALLSIKFRKFAKNLVFIHLTISVILFSQIYYPKYFDGERINFLGQISLFSGIVSLGFFNSINRFKNRFGNSVEILNKFGSELLLIFISIHLIASGFEGWITPQQWPGYLPPITLLSFLVAVFPFFIKNNILHK